MSSYSIREETVGGVPRLIIQVAGDVEITAANGQQIAFISGASRSLTFPAAASLTVPNESITLAKLAAAVAALLVPAPVDETDDGKVLTAEAGAFSWEDPA